METKNINVCETFPDGTPIDGWFYDTKMYLHWRKLENSMF